MRLFQRGVAVSVVALAGIPAAGAAATSSEQSTAACCLGDDNTAQLDVSERKPLVNHTEFVVVGCCPGGDHGQQLNSTGLGQTHPPGTDLSLDAAWRVYGFKRDGVEYFQVNDLAGRVQLIIGSVDGLFWALPAGEAVNHMVLPPQRPQVSKSTVPVEIYRHPAFSLMRYRVGDSAVWSVEVPGPWR